MFRGRLISHHPDLAKFVVVEDIDVGVVGLDLDERQIASLGDVFQHVLDARVTMQPLHIDAVNCVYRKIAIINGLTVTDISSEDICCGAQHTGCSFHLFQSEVRIVQDLPHIRPVSLHADAVGSPHGRLYH